MVISPFRVAVKEDGSFYIADLTRYIWRVDTNGLIWTFAGNGQTGWSGDGGPATNATISPYGIALDKGGAMYIADGSQHKRVRRVGSDGIIATVAGTGSEGSSGDGGPATNAMLKWPYDAAVGPDGAVFIADLQSECIRKIGVDGIIHTMAGDTNGASGSSGDGGLAVNARLNSPVGVVVDDDGVLYIADAGNRRVRRVGTDGIITTIAGTGVQGYSGDRGPATAAKLHFPYSVAVAPNGDIYVADYGTNCVRKISAVMPGIQVGDMFVPSQDGQLIYLFDYAGRHQRTISALTLSNLFTFAYTANGRLASITDGNNNTTTIEYNEAGAPTAIVGPYSHYTTLAMNSAGYLASVQNPAGETTVLGYSTNGLLASVQGAKGSDYTYTVSYNTAGRVTRGAEPAGAGGFTTYQYTSITNGFEVVCTTAMGRVKSVGVEDLTTGDRRRTQTNPDGSRWVVVNLTDGAETNTLPDGRIVSGQYTPDPRFGMEAPILAQEIVRLPSGLASTNTFQRTATMSSESPLSLIALTNTTIINGRTNISVYQVASRETTTTTPMGRQIRSTMNSQERPTSIRVTGLETVTNTYDDHGRLATRTTGGRVATWSYDAAGFVAKIVDAAGRTNQFSYDAVGRVTNQALAGDRTMAFAYDAHGNRTSLTPPGRSAHTFNYTVVDLPSEYTPPTVGGATNTTYYTYNADRQLMLITRPDGTTISNRYDSAGRRIARVIAEGQYTNAWLTNGLLGSVTSPDGVTLTYGYDGFLVKTFAWSGTVTGQVTFAYDNDFRLTSQSLNGTAITFGYDADSLLTNAGACVYRWSAENTLLTGSALGVVTDACTFNGFGEITAYTACSNGTAVFSRQYARDKLGRITNMVEVNGSIFRTNDYSYNSAGRLTQMVTNGTGTNLYYYDNNGNRLVRQSFSGGGTNTITAQYDGQDRLTSWTGGTNQFNAAGDLTNRVVNGLTNAYRYNALGHLLGVTLSGGTNITYRVDGLGRRVGKLVDNVFTQGWLYADGLLPIAELNHQSNVVSRFVYGEKDNVPDYMIREGTTRRIITDHLGSPRLVMNAADGTIVQEMEYDEFGRVLRDTNPGFQPFGFAGGLYDADSGLVRFGVRDYDAGTGRWITKDPILFSGGSFNLYVYVNNNPVCFRDSSGLGPLFQYPEPGPPPRPFISVFCEEIWSGIRPRDFNQPTPGSIAGVDGDIPISVKDDDYYTEDDEDQYPEQKYTQQGIFRVPVQQQGSGKNFFQVFFGEVWKMIKPRQSWSVPTRGANTGFQG